MKNKLKKSIYRSSWINCLQQQNYIRSKAIREIKAYIEKIKHEEDENNMTFGRKQMIKFFGKMCKVMNVTEQLTPAEISFKSFLLKEIIYDSGTDEHLPVSVYSYLKPTLGVQFIHHICSR